MTATRREIVQRARVHVGHREVTPNRSHLIDGWVRRCGLDPEKGPYPWCAAFASWCVDVAQPGAIKLGKMFPPTREPDPGDLMWFATDDAGAGHVGVVVEINDFEALCVEGNSENAVRLVRRVRAEVQFARTRSETWWTAPLVRVSKAGTR
jgi:hypothetical protein